MWEKNFWKIYSVSRCSSDIEHKPIIPKQQASSKFLFCPTKYVKKQVLFIVFLAFIRVWRFLQEKC